MELDQMRGFLETARERSFTKAAEKLLEKVSCAEN